MTMLEGTTIDIVSNSTTNDKHIGSVGNISMETTTIDILKDESIVGNNHIGYMYISDLVNPVRFSLLPCRGFIPIVDNATSSSKHIATLSAVHHNGRF